MSHTAAVTLLCATLASAPGVYQWRGSDGALVFSDRPPPASERPVGLQPVPAPNVANPFRPVGPRHRPPGSPQARSRQLLPATRSVVDCARLRGELAALWQKRRRGYAAAEAAALKKRVRALQATLRAQCGTWR